MEGVITSFAAPTTARIVSLLLMSIVLLLRPQGLFAKAVR
jgi:branched-chain amino acid transport system permease protein